MPAGVQTAASTNDHIGRYEVLRKIATGGMAELFLAKQVGLEGFEKVVAIKRILSHLAYDEEFINMFNDMIADSKTTEEKEIIFDILNKLTELAKSSQS